MSLNSTQPSVKQRSKILTISVLPLMFEDEKFRTTIETKISKENIEQLIASNNQDMYSFLK
jgi:hypothetical protein